MFRVKEVDVPGKTVIIKWKIKEKEGKERDLGEPDVKKQKLTEENESSIQIMDPKMSKEDGNVRGEDRAVDERSRDGSKNSSEKSELMIDVRRLKTEIRGKEEKLRKLKLVKMYRLKNDLDELDQLVTKWRTASQSACLELCNHMGTDGKRPTVRDLLTHWQIDHDIIGYSEEDDEFVEQ